MTGFNRRILAYPLLAILVWIALQLWVRSVGLGIERDERAGRTAAAILSTAKKYRLGLEDARAQSARDRAAARQSDARSRQVEDSNKTLEKALANATSHTDSDAVAVGDTGSATTWHRLFDRRSLELGQANVVIRNEAVSLGECRNTVADLARDTVTSSTALNRCAQRVDSLTSALDSLYQVRGCKILFIPCPSRQTSFVLGAVSAATILEWFSHRH